MDILTNTWWAKKPDLSWVVKICKLDKGHLNAMHVLHFSIQHSGTFDIHGSCPFVKIKFKHFQGPSDVDSRTFKDPQKPWTYHMPFYQQPLLSYQQSNKFRFF